MSPSFFYLSTFLIAMIMFGAGVLQVWGDRIIPVPQPQFIRCQDSSGPVISMKADRVRFDGYFIIAEFENPKSQYIYSVGPWTSCTIVEKGAAVVEELPKPVDKPRIIR